MLSPGCRLWVAAGASGGAAGEVEIASFGRSAGDGASPHGPTPTSPAEARRSLAVRLREAVDRQRVADVPLGAFLSGGLDSTAVVALLAEVSDDPVSTFTVAAGEGGRADRDHARLVAERFGTEHREVALSDEELTARVPEALAAQDHPSADGVNSWIVARAARKAGLTVALSGLGADELFGGYPTFDRLRRLARARPLLTRTPQAFRRAGAGLLRQVSGGVPAQKTADLLLTDGSVPAAYPILRSVIPPSRVERLLARDGGGPGIGGSGEEAAGWGEALARTFAGHPELSILERAARAECACYMHDVLLRDTDQMSMAHPLEVRVPLLDDAVVAYVRSLPDRVRFPRGAPPKALLAEALADRIPDEVLAREKRPFALPLGRWMRGPLRETCEAGLEAAADHPALDGDAVEGVWAAFLADDAGVPWKRPWLLVSLGRWMEREGVS